jgi:uncharacterized protein with HEPN domain
MMRRYGYNTCATRDAAQEIVTFTKNRTRSDLDSDQMLVRAVSMSCGIIGEAAARIDASFREEYAVIPWQQIIGMRNFLFHEYFRVDHDILWNTATIAVPALIPQLVQILQEIDNQLHDLDDSES